MNVSSLDDLVQCSLPSQVQKLTPTTIGSATNYNVTSNYSSYMPASVLPRQPTYVTSESEIPLYPVNYHEDIGLDDKALATIPTKELNKLLKKKNIGKIRIGEFKVIRRTLKNRGI